VMKSLRFLFIVLLAFDASNSSAASLAAEPPQQPSRVDFMRDIQPIFAANCYKCHGPKESRNGLRLDRRRNALEGGDSGPALIPGKSADSRLIRYVTGENDEKIIMPQKGER